MSIPVVRPLLTRLLSANADHETIDALSIANAVKHAEVVRAARQIEQSERQREILRFEEMGGPSDAAAALSDDDDSVGSAESFDAHLDSVARRVFRTPCLRPKQRTAIKRIIADGSTDGKLLVVDRTGGGKSLILYMTAIAVGGITLVIVPLLSLTANQISRIEQAVQRYGTVASFNLDETDSSEIHNKIIPKMDSLPYNSSTSMILLCSPQFLSEDFQLRSALLRARDRQVLRLIALDEAHLYAMGGAYRASIRLLARSFFARLYKFNPQFYPLFLAMTATMPVSQMKALHELTHIPWADTRHQLISSPFDFRQRYIDMDFIVQGEVASLGVSPMVDVLSKHADAHVCAFVNFKSECAKIGALFESKLVQAKLDVDVLQINGDMDKHEKFAFIRLFTSSIKLKTFHPNVLIATPAANTGFDQTLVCWVLSVGLPRCMTSLLQERGRNRNAGKYVVMTNWVMFVKLLLSILIPPSARNDSGELRDVQYINTMLKTKSPDKRDQDASGTKVTAQQTSHLSQTKKQDLIASALKDLVDVTNYLFLPDLGCIHLRAEWYLHRGAMESLPSDWPNDEHPACANKCYVCRGSHKKYMLPVVHAGAVDFLDSDHFSGRGMMPYVITHESANTMTNKLWESSDWRKRVFGLKKVTKFNVNCFFFQLIALGLLEFQWASRKREVICVLGTDDNNRIKYKFVQNWKGFSFRSNNNRGRSIPHSELATE